MMAMTRKSKIQMMMISIENIITCFIIGSILPLKTTSTTIEIAQLVGRTIFLNCTKSSSVGIVWRFNEYTLLYNGAEFTGAFKGRSGFEIDAATGNEVLKISNIRPGDAGLYKCVNSSNEKALQSTQLTALDSEPICDSNIKDNGFNDPNTCGNVYGLNQDDMRFSCAVSYYGTAPRLQWQTVNGNQIFKDSECDKNQTAKSINCTLTLKAETEYDGSNFRCKVVTSHGEHYSCSTKAIKVIYFTPDERALKPTYIRKAIGDEISCSVKSNLKLDFIWTREENSKEDVVGTNRSYVIDKEGLYYCNVSYSIKEASCWIVLSVVQTPHHTEPGWSLKSLAIVDILVLIVYSVHSVLFLVNKKIKGALKQLDWPMVNGWSRTLLSLYAMFDLILLLFNTVRPNGKLLNMKYALTFILLIFTFLEVSCLLLLKWKPKVSSTIVKIILLLLFIITIGVAIATLVIVSENGRKDILAIFFFDILIIFACGILVVFAIQLRWKVPSWVVKVILFIFVVFCFSIALALIFNESVWSSINIMVIILSVFIVAFYIFMAVRRKLASNTNETKAQELRPLGKATSVDQRSQLQQIMEAAISDAILTIGWAAVKHKIFFALNWAGGLDESHFAQIHGEEHGKTGISKLVTAILRGREKDYNIFEHVIKQELKIDFGDASKTNEVEAQRLRPIGSDDSPEAGQQSPVCRLVSEY